MVMANIDDIKIAVIGLGYVGLPLAAYFAREFPVTGFDIDPKRIAELQNGIDRTREVTDEEMAAAKHLSFATDRDQLAACNFFIVTVPTPIDTAKRPDLTALEKASETVGRAIRRGGIVVYESTVYPGATEEVCIPIVERVSGLTFNVDFYAGYSPERINPGDHQHRLPSIKKIASGSTPEIADLVDAVYARIITAGTHKASSIRVAEAAKVIENIQRDVNIALVNELAMLLKKMGIETREVLEAAGTKWNFHGYRPGLVGGHCIGVDPYYLTHKANMIGFHPQVILSGRRTNDGMAQFVAHDILKLMLKRKVVVDSARLLVLGFTFKEDCPDTRNTKIADLVADLAAFIGEIVIFDPFADRNEARHEYGVEIVNDWPDTSSKGVFDGVRHAPFVKAGIDAIRAHLKPGGFVYDVKGVFPVTETDARL